MALTIVLTALRCAVIRQRPASGSAASSLTTSLKSQQHAHTCSHSSTKPSQCTRHFSHSCVHPFPAFSLLEPPAEPATTSYPSLAVLPPRPDSTHWTCCIVCFKPLEDGGGRILFKSAMRRLNPITVNRPRAVCKALSPSFTSLFSHSSWNVCTACDVQECLLRCCVALRLHRTLAAIGRVGADSYLHSMQRNLAIGHIFANSL